MQPALGITLGNLDYLDTLDANMSENLTTLTDTGIEIVVFRLPEFAQIAAVVVQLEDAPAIRDASLAWRDRLKPLSLNEPAFL